jgi:MinD-like ATPase involved in chromosome partitioning or flagellar assembly
MDLGIPQQKGLYDLLSGSPVEITREKVNSVLVTHSSGLKLLLASENPRDVQLINQTGHYEILVTRLANLARFVVLDLGAGLPSSVQKILPLCTDRIIIVEGLPNTIAHTKVLIDEIAGLSIDRLSINVVLNNRIRTETQMPWTEVQKSLGHSIKTILTPAPEMFMAATRLHTPAIFSQPTNVTSQQILKIADEIIEREKLK